MTSSPSPRANSLPIGELGTQRRREFLRLSIALLSGSVAAACATREAAVPIASTEQAAVLGIPNARYWADTQGSELAEEALRAVAREREHLGLTGKDRLPPASFLAVSGGSDNGAFGAGLLVGWTEAGNRPSFKLVTGVSTGALTAPFAFLGPAYDPQLKYVYTGIKPSDVYEQRSYLVVPFQESMADTQPLFHWPIRSPFSTWSPVMWTKR